MLSANRFLKMLILTAMGALIPVQHAYADFLVYEKTAEQGFVRLEPIPASDTPGQRQEGDQIILDGGQHPAARVVTQFSVGYVPFGLASGGLSTGIPNAEIRFYANDAHNISEPHLPGTLLYDSGPIPITMRLSEQDLQTRILTVDHLAVKVPDTFTWTLSFGGAPTNSFPGGLVFSPEKPIVGMLQTGWASYFGGPQSFCSPCDFILGKIGGYSAEVFARPGNAPAAFSGEFAQQSMSVATPSVMNPEPSTILLLATGIIAFAAHRYGAKRNQRIL